MCPALRGVGAHVFDEYEYMKIPVNAKAGLDRVVNFFALLAVLIMAFVLLAVNSDIVMRYFLNNPSKWVTEVSEYAILWMTFFASAWVLKNEKHVVMDIILIRVRPGIRNTINMVTSLFGAALCLIVTWYGIVVTLDLFQRKVLLSSSIDPMAYPLFTIIPIGSFLLAIQFIIRALGFLGSREAAGNE